MKLTTRHHYKDRAKKYFKSICDFFLAVIVAGIKKNAVFLIIIYKTTTPHSHTTMRECEVCSRGGRTHISVPQKCTRLSRSFSLSVSAFFDFVYEDTYLLTS